MRKEKIEILDKEDIPKTNKINIILICIINGKILQFLLYYIVDNSIKL